MQDTKRRLTARILRGAEYIFFSRPDSNSPQTALCAALPDGRQPEAAQGAVEPRSGTNGKDEKGETKPPQTFLEEFLPGHQTLAADIMGK
jgi:hypothetical protein